jgi:hypothetical protein
MSQQPSMPFTPGQNPTGSQGTAGGNTGKMGSPDPMTVKMFHLYDDTDSEQGAHHHTLGVGNNQAASGSHSHNGSDSVLLLDGVTLSGSRGTATAMPSIIAALTQLGAVDQTTA